jgi:hypothetical protein
MFLLPYRILVGFGFVSYVQNRTVGQTGFEWGLFSEPEHIFTIIYKYALQE